MSWPGAVLLLIPQQPAPAPPPPPPGDKCASGAITADCIVPDIIGGVAGAVVKSGIDAVAESFAKSVQPLLTAIFSYWTAAPTADLTSLSSPAQLMQGHLHWLSAAIAVVAIGVAAARLVLNRRPENAADLARSLGLLFFASVMAVPVFNLLLEFGDEFSTWILAKSASGPFAEQFVAFVAVGSLGSLGPLTMMLVSLAAVVGGFVQLLFMFIRNAVLLVIIGTYPMAAAAASTPTGRAWFQKQTGWILAFILFKPVASIIYATAFLAIRDESSTINVILGVVLLIVAAMALPALMKVAAPMTAAVAAGGGGGGMGAAVGAVGIAASGAMAWKGRSSGASAPGGGPGGGSAPSGARRPGGGGGPSGGPSSAAPGGRPGGGVRSGSAAGGGAGRAATGGRAAAGGAAAGGGAAGGGAAASGAAGGPAGMSAAAAAQVATAAARKVKQGAEDAAGGPSGAGGER